MSTIKKEQRKTNYSNHVTPPATREQTEKQEKLENRNGKKKQLYGYLKQQTGEIVNEKSWTRLRKEIIKNLKLFK